MARRHVDQFTYCTAPPTHAGYVGRRRITEFPGDAHASEVEDAAPMTNEDRAELDGRIIQCDRAIAGLPYERVGPAVDRPGDVTK
jgi:hypothetical protein